MGLPHLRRLRHGEEDQRRANSDLVLERLDYREGQDGERVC